MEDILSRVSKADIIRDPYPHIIVKNALDPALADALRSAYPSLNTLASGHQGFGKREALPNNLKLRYDSLDVEESHGVGKLWKDFVALHTAPAFSRKFLSLFSEEIIRLHPHLEPYLSGITDSDIGVKRRDGYDAKKLLVTAEICADTPVRERSSVRPPHLDHPHKLAVALLYLRTEENDSTGGEFEIYQVKKNKFVIDHTRVVKSRYLPNLEKITSVPYAHNTLLLFVNSLHSFHGVSPREVTTFPRYAFDMAFDIASPVFSLAPYAENMFIRKARGYFLTFTGRHKETV